MIRPVIVGAQGTVAAQLPSSFAAVRYVGERFPGGPGVSGIAAGANCQLYAYAVLAHFGVEVPPVRSSELWTDQRLETVSGLPIDLDLVFFNASADPYGAHVGVVVAPDGVLHLCAELGHPAVWKAADFAARDRYRVRIGCRRVRRV